MPELKDQNIVLKRYREMVGRNINLMRRASGLTGEEFSKKLGVSRTHLYRLENGIAYGAVFEAIYHLGKITEIGRLFTEDITFNYTREDYENWKVSVEEAEHA